MRLRGNDSILNEGLGVNGVDTDDDLSTPIPLRDKTVETSFNSNLPDTLDIDFEKSLDFNVNIVELIKNDISNDHVPILDSQKVILHSIAFFIGFSLILFIAGIIKYIKTTYKRSREKKLGEGLEEWIDTTDINLAEWKCNHSSIRRIEDFEDVTINDKNDNDVLSRKSTISDFETDSESSVNDDEED